MRQPSAGRMLVGDSYIAARLLKDVLHRTTGISRDASFLTTVFTIGVLANALRRIAAPALRVLKPRRPSGADTMIAVAVLREIPGSIAGVQARGEPFVGTIIALSIVASGLRPLTASVRRVPAALVAFRRSFGV
jgi:hypothetical protein